MEKYYDIYIYDSESFSSVNLGNLPKEVIEAVYNICRFLYDRWDITNRETKKEFEALVDFFENPDKILLNVISLKEKDMENLPVLVLQIATFRFLRVHLLQIFNTLEKEDWKNSSRVWNSHPLLEQVNIEEWEKFFWLIASGQAKKASNSLRNFAPYFVKPMNLERIVKSAMEHKDIVQQIKQLQQEYEPYFLKAEKFNHAAKQYTKEQREEKLVAVQNMKKIIEMLEKNLSGELTISDIVEAEKQFLERKEALENLAETVNELYGCSHPAKQQ